MVFVVVRYLFLRKFLSMCKMNYCNILFFVLIFLIVFFCVDEEVGIFLVYCDFMVVVYSMVMVELFDLYMVYVLVSGVVEECFVLEGEMVVEGVMMFVL